MSIDKKFIEMQMAYEEKIKVLEKALELACYNSVAIEYDIKEISIMEKTKEYIEFYKTKAKEMENE